MLRRGALGVRISAGRFLAWAAPGVEVMRVGSFRADMEAFMERMSKLPEAEQDRLWDRAGRAVTAILDAWEQQKGGTDVDSEGQLEEGAAVPSRGRSDD